MSEEETQHRTTDPFEAETCEGCAWFSEFSGPMCTRKNCETNGAYGGGRECDNFVLSLQCRQVRALEALGDLSACIRLTETGGAIEVLVWNTVE